MHVPSSPDELARAMLVSDPRILEFYRADLGRRGLANDDQTIFECLASTLGDFYTNGLNNANKCARAQPARNFLDPKRVVDDTKAMGDRGNVKYQGALGFGLCFFSRSSQGRDNEPVEWRLHPEEGFTNIKAHFWDSICNDWCKLCKYKTKKCNGLVGVTQNEEDGIRELIHQFGYGQGGQHSKCTNGRVIVHIFVGFDTELMAMTHNERVQLADDAMNAGYFLAYDREHACFHTQLSIFGSDYAQWWTTALLDPYFVQQGMVASHPIASGHTDTRHMVAVSVQNLCMTQDTSRRVDDSREGIKTPGGLYLGFSGKGCQSETSGMVIGSATMACHHAFFNLVQHLNVANVWNEEYYIGLLGGPDADWCPSPWHENHNRLTHELWATNNGLSTPTMSPAYGDLHRMPYFVTSRTPREPIDHFSGFYRPFGNGARDIMNSNYFRPPTFRLEASGMPTGGGGGRPAPPPIVSELLFNQGHVDREARVDVLNNEMFVDGEQHHIVMHHGGENSLGQGTWVVLNVAGTHGNGVDPARVFLQNLVTNVVHIVRNPVKKKRSAPRSGVSCVPIPPPHNQDPGHEGGGGGGGSGGGRGGAPSPLVAPSAGGGRSEPLLAKRNLHFGEPHQRKYRPHVEAYLMASTPRLGQYYIGSTAGPRQLRLEAHNNGRETTTASTRPHRMIVSMKGFDPQASKDMYTAYHFEKWMHKTASRRPGTVVELWNMASCPPNTPTDLPSMRGSARFSPFVDVDPSLLRGSDGVERWGIAFFICMAYEWVRDILRPTTFPCLIIVVPCAFGRSISTMADLEALLKFPKGSLQKYFSLQWH
jgi:predicted GIY-YIG superfamily endonuclease